MLTAMSALSTIGQSFLLLTFSNVFMTFAWYGHLKYFHDWPAWKVIPIAWSVAFFEYCFQVPANRIGFTVLDGYKLKIMQEVITLVVFAVFAKLVLGEELRWNYMVSFALLGGAAYFAFAFKS